MKLPPGFHVGDSRHMDEVQDASVTLILTSPPYNLDLEYEKGVKFEDWFSLISEVLKECDRTLKDGGRVCINVPTGIHRNPAIPIDYYVMKIALEELHWWQRGRIIWLKPYSKSRNAWGSFCKASNPTLRDSHEVVLVFNKGKESIEKGDSGISRYEFIEFTRSEWIFRPEYHDVGHPAPFPEELARRCILLFTNKGDTVLDPFSGSGTTYKVAKALDRVPIAYELNPAYIPVMLKRLNTPIVIQSDAAKQRDWIDKTFPEFAGKTRTELVIACKELGIEANVNMTRVSMMDAIDKQRKTKRLESFI